MILSPKHLPRLAAIVGLFTTTACATSPSGRDCLASRAPVAPTPGEEAPGDIKAKAKAFRERLVELGPAYIKLGQVLSTRPDLLPVPYIKELEHLQDNVPPMDFEQVEKTHRGGAGRSHQQAVRIVRAEAAGQRQPRPGPRRAASRRTQRRRQGAASQHARAARRRNRVLPRAGDVSHRAYSGRITHRPGRCRAAAGARAGRRARLPH